MIVSEVLGVKSFMYLYILACLFGSRMTQSEQEKSMPFGGHNVSLQV